MRIGCHCYYLPVHRCLLTDIIIGNPTRAMLGWEISWNRWIWSHCTNSTSTCCCPFWRAVASLRTPDSSCSELGGFQFTDGWNGWFFAWSLQCQTHQIFLKARVDYVSSISSSTRSYVCRSLGTQTCTCVIRFGGSGNWSMLPVRPTNKREHL